MLGLPDDLAAIAERPECGWVTREWTRLAIAGRVYDRAAADAAAAFFPSWLRLTDGEWAGRPFILSPWQEASVRIAFGLKNTDGLRAIRRVLMWVPRKNGKTELLAGVSLLALLGDGEFGGQAYALATDEKQAKIVFGKAATMVRMSPGLSSHLEVLAKAIYSPQLNAAFRPLSGNPTGKHGMSASFIGGDEMHEWPDERLYTFVHQSVAARRQPLEWLISTAGIRGRGFGWTLFEESERIVSGLVEDPESLVVIYAAGADDDWSNEENWVKANPNIGTSPKWAYLRSEFKRAKESPRLENDFRRYHLNQWTEQAVRWLALDVWDENKASDWRDITGFDHRLAYAGLDLSSTSDITAFVLLFPPREPGERWRIVPKFWVPAESIELRARRDRVPYDLWQRQSAIEPTEGNVVDYAAVEAAVKDAFKRYDIRRLAVDPYNATRTVQALQDEMGQDRVHFLRQGFLSLSAPTKELERLVLGRSFDHGGHPVLRWMAGNVAVSNDAAGNLKPAKDRSTEKIDGIAALVNALGASMAGGPSTIVKTGFVDIDYGSD